MIGLCAVAISAFLAFCGDDEPVYSRQVGEVMRALESHRGSLRVQGLLVKGSLCQQGHAPECEIRFALRNREVAGGSPSLPVRYGGCALPEQLFRHAQLAPDVTVEGRLYDDSPRRGERPEKSWFRTMTDAPPRLNPERAYLEAERVLVKTGGPLQMRRKLLPDGGHGPWVSLPEPPPPAPPPCR